MFSRDGDEKEPRHPDVRTSATLREILKSPTERGRAETVAYYALLLAKLDVYYSFLPDAYNYTGNATPAPIPVGRISRFLNENFCQQTTVCTALSYINYTRTCCTSDSAPAFLLSLSLSLSLCLFPGSQRANKGKRGYRENNFHITLQLQSIMSGY